MCRYIYNWNIVACDIKQQISLTILQKKVWEELGRVKPMTLDRDKEKSLQRIAQRYVGGVRACQTYDFR